MPAVRRSPIPTAFWRVHRLVDRWSGGRLGTGFAGIQVIELTTIGRKSGQPRQVMLNAFQIDGRLAVVGSNAGSDRFPLWYLNLEKNPSATVSIRGAEHEVVANIVHGDERDAVWEQVTQADASYAEYQERTEREIPVVILDPIDGE